MTTATTIDRAKTFSRPAARFDDDGNPASGTGQALEVRASAALNCRRALWYAATGYALTNPPTEKSLMAMEAGNALEPVVARAMERAGWSVDSADPRDPQTVTVKVGPKLLVTGHPDGTVRIPLPRDRERAVDATVQMFLFEEEEKSPTYGEEMVVEVKTRGPEAFKRWRTLGAERSHPASVTQAALYTLGQFGEMRDAVIATMDTGSRTWDHEVIPAHGWSGPCSTSTVAGAADRPPRPPRAGPRHPARQGFLRRQLAVPVLSFLGHLPAGQGCRRGGRYQRASRGACGDRRGGTGGGDGLYRGPAVHEGTR